LDSNKNNMLEEYEFQEVCQDIGYTDSCAALFQQLRKDKHQRYLTLADIECKGVILTGVLTAGGALPKDSSMPKVFHRRDADLLSPVEKARVSLTHMQELRSNAKKKQLSANDSDALKKLLIRKYGSITAAWRHGLDFSGNGKCSFIEFSRACRDMGYSGNIKAAFKELNTGQKGIMTFNELDPVWYARLSSFRALLEETFGTELADSNDLMEVFDKNGNNTIEVEEFVEVCKHIGYIDDPEALFRQLRRDPSRKFISMDDIRAKGVMTFAVTRFDKCSSSPCLKRPSSQQSCRRPSSQQCGRLNSSKHRSLQLERSIELSKPSTPQASKRYFC